MLASHEEASADLFQQLPSTRRERVPLAWTTMVLCHQLAVLARSATRPQCSPVGRCVGPVVKGVVARAGSPHNRATRHGPTQAPTRGTAPPAAVARADVAQTAGRRLRSWAAELLVRIGFMTAKHSDGPGHEP